MIVVQKYGGSSLATTKQLKKVAQFIKDYYTAGKQVVVVASARGKTTNTLLATANELTHSPNACELDKLLATGELQSVALLALTLNEIGVPAVSLSGAEAGIVTNQNFGKAFIEKINPHLIKSHLKNGKVVIVAGFQGISKNGETTTLGRGGSDTTAVALASALRAKCEIYTDVAGLFAVDPNKHKCAKHLQQIPYNCAIEMSFAGVKAMETRACELAMKYNLNLYVGKSLAKHQTKGTKFVKRINEKVKVLGVGIKPQLATLTIKTTKDKMQKVEKFVFDFMTKHYLSCEMSSKMQIGNKSLLCICLDEKSAKQCKTELKQLDKVCVETTPCAKVSLVGVGIATHTNIIQRATNALHNSQIEFDNLSTNDTTLNFIVSQNNAEKASKVLVKEFALTSKRKMQIQKEHYEKI